MAMSSLQNIREANKELTMANKYNDSYGKWWATVFFIMGLAILILDFVL